MNTPSAPKPRSRRKWLAVAGALTAVAVAAAGCGSTSGGASSASAASTNREVTLAGFSILKAPNANLIKDFGSTAAGKGVTFNESYGASGDQSRAVLNGLKADYVHFSLATDITRLSDAGIVAKDWASGATKGIASQTLVVLTVRKGNPKHITGWDDLVKPGIKIVTPNPGSSGSARWNILAAWGHVIDNGGTPAAAKAFVTKIIDNAVLPSSGHDATTQFESGVGDVLISYETEAIIARAKGADLDYIIPADTLLIQNPAAVTTTASPSAKAFLNFVTSKEGQLDYAKAGFRPLVDVGAFTTPGANDPSNPYPAPSQKLLTIDADFGGWAVAAKKFFDENDGIITKILAAAGKQ
jgi:sulfate/thiosulfate-binding protein